MRHHQQIVTNHVNPIAKPDPYRAGSKHGAESARAGKPNTIPSAPILYTDQAERDLWQSGFADGWSSTYWHEVAQPDSVEDYR